MRVAVVTIFPGYFDGALAVGMVFRAIETGALVIDPIDLRTWGVGVHRAVDDAPFGGGPGMVMSPGPLAEALDSVPQAHRIFLTPSGVQLTQEHLDRWAEMDEVVLVCGRYEGIDQRIIDNMIDEEVSLGDFVLAGGEPAALAVIEGIARLLPGVLGNPESVKSESFRDGLLEEPVYTRPAEFRGWTVPEVLLSGDHGRIEAWRRERRLERTRQRRPDLLDDHDSGPISAL
jgi:tRNA (guanine37-N1)-methyltransferase